MCCRKRRARKCCCMAAVKETVRPSEIGPFACKRKDVMILHNTSDHIQSAMKFMGGVGQFMRVRSWQPAVLILSPSLLVCALYVRDISWEFWLFVVCSGYIMRSIGCVWNDLCDQEFDKKVARTRSRAIASGLGTRRQAVGLLLVLGVVGGALVGAFDLWGVAFVCLAGGGVYSLCKRWTYMSQLILGCVINTGVFLAPYYTHSAVHMGHILFYIGGVAWAFVYDTIYGLQDYPSDISLGLKGTHMLVAHASLENVLRLVMMGVVACWACAGVFFDMGVGYYVLAAMSWSWVRSMLRGLGSLQVLALKGFFAESVYWSLGWIASILADRMCGVKYTQLFKGAFL